MGRNSYVFENETRINSQRQVRHERRRPKKVVWHNKAMVERDKPSTYREGFGGCTKKPISKRESDCLWDWEEISL